MIQVCSQCGTRWNVREQQRGWCPRCRGTLLAPLSDVRQNAPAPQRTPPPPGYRWIAVRPGVAPPARTRRRLLGPTPRYAVIPRWGLADRVDEASAPRIDTARRGPSAATVRTTLVGSVVVLGIAALAYIARYMLLVINRNTLLNSAVAGAGVWLPVVASLAAVGAVTTCALMLTRWLIARRAAAFAHRARPEPRRGWALWAGCVVPLANLVWAPVYAIELAGIEDHCARLRRPIVVWWIAWIFSTAVSTFAIVTSGAQDARGIANNALATVLGYLLAAAAVAALARVFDGFERKPIERPAHRWVVVADASAGPVELAGQEPAA